MKRRGGGATGRDETEDEIREKLYSKRYKQTKKKTKTPPSEGVDDLLEILISR